MGWYAHIVVRTARSKQVSMPARAQAVATLNTDGAL
jgi:hypothetical protein